MGEFGIGQPVRRFEDKRLLSAEGSDVKETAANPIFLKNWISCVRCSARSRDRPTSRLMRRLREQWMCRACLQPTFRLAVLISSSKKT
jgi:hypothetical protein